MNIKKTAASLLAAVMLTGTAMSAVGTFAADVIITDGILDEETGLFYEPLNDGTLRVTLLKDSAVTASDITVPETYDGKTVSTIDWDITKNLTSIFIPKTITNINHTGGSNITDVSIAEDNPSYSVMDGVLFNKDKTKLLAYPAGKLETAYSIPETVTVIDYNSFQYSILEEILIPNSVKTINGNAFKSCHYLTSLNIPASVEKFGGGFNGSGISAITVDAQNNNYCAIDGVVFSKDLKTLVAYPVGNTAEEYVVPDGTEVIGSGAFRGSQYLKAIELPESILEIKNAFYSCYELLSVKIPDKVTVLDGAFDLCHSLESVTLPLGIKTIERSTFRNCVSLKTIYFNGTKADWDMIEIDPRHNLDMNHATIYFSDGTSINGAGLIEETDTSTDQTPETTTNEDGTKDFTPGVERKGVLSNADFETMKQIKASAPAGAFGDDVKMNVSRSSSAASGNSFAVDITFTDDSGEVQPAKEIVVMIPVPAKLKNAEKIFLYHIGNDNKPVKVEAETQTVDGEKYIVFKADHFSIFMLTDTEIKTDGTGGDDNTNSGDSNTSSSDGGSTGSTGGSSSTGSSNTSSACSDISSETTNSDTSSEPASSALGYTESVSDTPESSSSVPSGDNANPSTGAAFSVLPIAAAISAVVVIKKKK